VIDYPKTVTCATFYRGFSQKNNTLTSARSEKAQPHFFFRSDTSQKKIWMHLSGNRADLSDPSRDAGLWLPECSSSTSLPEQRGMTDRRRFKTLAGAACGEL
jgi:hypothetical protein